MIVLDTHALIWLADDPGKLGPTARQAITEDGEPALSTISAYEIADLARRGRIELDRPVNVWVRDALRSHGVQALAPSVRVVLRAGSLPTRFPGDPADRIIYATAREHDVKLVSRDTKISGFDPPRVVW